MCDNKCIRKTISRIIDIALLGGLQLALDQSPRTGKERSYKLEELFQLQRLTADMHLWRPTIATQVVTLTQLWLRRPVMCQNFSPEWIRAQGIQIELEFGNLGLALKLAHAAMTCWQKILLYKAIEITISKANLELNNKCSKETCIKESTLRGIV